MPAFKGKQTKAEEMKEAKMVRTGKVSPAQYAKREKAEGNPKSMKSLRSDGKALATGKMTAGQYASKATGTPRKK
jgi:hypothetical protein